MTSTSSRIIKIVAFVVLVISVICASQPQPLPTNPLFTPSFSGTVIGTGSVYFDVDIPQYFGGVGNWNFTLYYCRSRGDTVNKVSDATNGDSCNVAISLKYGVKAENGLYFLTDSIIVDSGQAPSGKTYIDFAANAGRGIRKSLIKLINDSLNARGYNFYTVQGDTAVDTTTFGSGSLTNQLKVTRWLGQNVEYPQFTFMRIIFTGKANNRKLYDSTRRGGSRVNAVLIGEPGTININTNTPSFFNGK